MRIPPEAGVPVGFLRWGPEWGHRSWVVDEIRGPAIRVELWDDEELGNTDRFRRRVEAWLHGKDELNAKLRVTPAPVTTRSVIGRDLEELNVRLTQKLAGRQKLNDRVAGWSHASSQTGHCDQVAGLGTMGGP